MSGSRKNRRWTNLLLNARFQLKYCFMLLGISSLLSAGLGSYLVKQLRENSRMLQLEAELDAAFQEALAASDAQVVAVMVGALVLFNVLIFLGGIFVTHRMAGPVFVFKRYLSALSEGRIPVIRKLRKGDEFKELLDAMEVAVDSIHERTEAEIDLLSRAANAVSDGGLKQELRAQVEAKRDSLMERTTGDLGGG